MAKKQKKQTPDYVNIRLTRSTHNLLLKCSDALEKKTGFRPVLSDLVKVLVSGQYAATIAAVKTK